MTTQDEARSRSVKFTDEEFAAIEKAAERAAKSPHAWMRDVLLATAGRSKLAEQIGPLVMQASVPPAFTAAFKPMETANEKPETRYHWLFVYTDHTGRATTIFGHVNGVTASTVRLGLWNSPGNQEVELPRARIVAWEKLPSHESHDPALAFARWQLWGARVHRSMYPGRHPRELLPPWDTK